ncbi:uncharacterized protein AMSG_12197 [Thecamonas trahens ATCC 50062]|uniref:AAA+ ATPase domain-containing protein n=1 Tax=Thecamonas trahens ATCC 50062 TaxID=461836 RepID=A0A0L0DLW6_THETB|nr:hypothetical protein AMSG_12197 [Thecamonas trahens ATCC 50062]KNC53245.1 hypothetical protein AMSG_12197 [Thecamonas trahens ATCC 50062]|eukprot:XP_013754596.1 hypothetical protein AMSG_12197 [Thecamonas trahens ATCC 50062]
MVAWPTGTKTSRGPQGRAEAQGVVAGAAPPAAYWNNPVTSLCSRFAHTSTNKQPFPVNAVCWTPEGRRLVMGVSSGEFSLWNGLCFNFETLQQSHDKAVRAMEWSHDEDWMISCDDAGVVKYWQPNFNNVKTLQAHESPIQDISFSPTDMKFVTCSDDTSLKIWDFNNVREETSLYGHQWEVKTVQWHPEKCLIASGSKDRLIKLWDARTGKSLTSIHAHKECVQSVHWNPVNGNWLLSGSRDQLIKLFDIRMMREVQSFRGHSKEVCSVRWHPIHEELFASGGSVGDVLFWLVGHDDVQDSILNAHESQVFALDWHPMGHILTSGSNDRSAKFWSRQRMGDTERELYNPEARKAARMMALHQQVAATQVSSTEVTEFSTPLAGFGLDADTKLAVPALPLKANPEVAAQVAEATRNIKSSLVKPENGARRGPETKFVPPGARPLPPGIRGPPPYVADRCFAGAAGSPGARAMAARLTRSAASLASVMPASLAFARHAGSGQLRGMATEAGGPLSAVRGWMQNAIKGFENFDEGGARKRKAGDDAASKESGSEQRARPEKKKGEDGGSGKPPPPENEPSTATVASLVASIGLFGAVLYMMPSREAADGGPREMTFQDFKRDYLYTGKVDRLEVMNGEQVRVFAYDYVPGGADGTESVALEETPGTSIGLGKAPKFVGVFSIGSVETLERQMDEAQWELALAPEDYVPITYKSEMMMSSIMMAALPTLVLIGFWIWAMRRFSGGGAGPGGPGGSGPGSLLSITKAKTTTAGSVAVPVKFADVAGMDEAKQEIVEFVEFLKHPSKFTELGAKPPKGAILVGPPGTGKTMLAKAMAGEADVPFFSISGSDFIEMFVGVGPSRVRDLFKQARATTPSIIFIDEIDAIGKKRSSGGFSSGGSDERENTLNQLLVEMDGFDSKDEVVVVASTNRVDILDPALLRPGRFDRQIAVDNPDIRGREDIFKVHLAKVKLAETDSAAVDKLRARLAELTPGFSGADIANVVNEAALLAGRYKASGVEYSHFEAAIDRVIGGLERRSRVLSPEEKVRVAYHEAGHALVGWLLEHTDPLLKVSIVPRGQAALGYAQYVPKERFLYAEEELRDRICMMLGGRVAEELKFGVISTGARDDLDKVTKLTYSLITKFGFSPSIGQLSFPDQGEMEFEKPYSEETAAAIDLEARAIIDDAYARTKDVIGAHMDKLEEIGKLLMEKEVMRTDDMLAILGPRPHDPPAEPETKASSAPAAPADSA